MGLIGQKTSLSEELFKRALNESSVTGTKTLNGKKFEFEINDSWKMGPNLDAIAQANTKDSYEKLFGKGSWDELNPIQQRQYFYAYKEGRLDKAVDFAKRMDDFHKEVATINDPKQATYKLIGMIAETVPEIKNATDQETKIELCKEKILDFIGKRNNFDPQNLSQQDKEFYLERFGVLLQAGFYAEQNGKIDSLLDLESLTDTEIMDLEYEYAGYVKDNYRENYNSNITLQIAKEKGNMERAIVAGCEEIKSVEELRNSELRYHYTYEYLKNKPAEALSEYEKKQLAALSQIAKKYDGDFTNYRADTDNSVCASFASTIKNDNKHINWDDTNNIILLKNKIIEELDSCQTEEERHEFLERVIKTNGVDETLAVFDALAMVQKAGKVSTQELIDAQKCTNNSSHNMALCSGNLDAEGQSEITDYTIKCSEGENAEITANQLAATMKNICTQHDESVQSDNVNKIIATGRPAVKEAVSDTMDNMTSESARQKTFEYTMTSNVFTEEEKQNIARDRMDSIERDSSLSAEERARLKELYQQIAESQNIDYTKGTPKSERTSGSDKSNNTAASEQKIGDSDMTVNEFKGYVAQALLEQEQQNNITNPLEWLQMGLNAAKESAANIAGQITDINTTGIRKIESLNTARLALKKGISFPQVFKNCSTPIKKQFISTFCQHYPEGLKLILTDFNNKLMVFDYAQTPEAKRTVLEVWKSMPDSTSQNDLNLALKQNPEMKKIYNEDNSLNQRV